MTTHLYCVLPVDSGGVIPADLTGIAGGAVRALPMERFALWVSDIPPDLPLTIDGVKAHDAVVEAALATGSTPVPARYGQRFESDAACVASVGARAPLLESLLSTVQGLVEMTLILTPTTRRIVRELQPVLPALAADSGPGVGTRYLERLRAREAANGAVRGALDALGRRLADAAQRFVRESAVHEQLTRMPFRTISHLIARELVDQYEAAIRGVPATTESRFLVVGPRAPYSFCALGGGGATHGMKLAD